MVNSGQNTALTLLWGGERQSHETLRAKRSVAKWFKPTFSPGVAGSDSMSPALPNVLDARASFKHHPRMPNASHANENALSLDETILALCHAAPLGRTICPIDAAQAFAVARREDALGWRSHLTEVRRTAVRLAAAGRIVIFRKGKPADPHDFRGVYRLGLPSRD